MSKTNATPLGALTRDDNNTAVQSANGFATSDATASPQSSPISYTTGVVTIVVPDNAIECILMPTTDLRVSTDSGVAAYDLIKANTKESIPCTRTQNIYVQRDASNGSLYFRFHTV